MTSPPSPTDGSPARASGACFGYASPEAALRGPLCAVRDGDWVHYDIEKRELTIELSDEELQRRMAEAELRAGTQDGLAVHLSALRGLHFEGCHAHRGPPA